MIYSYLSAPCLAYISQSWHVQKRAWGIKFRWYFTSNSDKLTDDTIVRFWQGIAISFLDCTGCQSTCNPVYGCVEDCPAGKEQSTLCRDGKPVCVYVLQYINSNRVTDFVSLLNYLEYVNIDYEKVLYVIPFSFYLCYCTAELLSSRWRPSSVRPSIVRPCINPFSQKSLSELTLNFGGKVPLQTIFKFFYFIFLMNIFRFR